MRKTALAQCCDVELVVYVRGNHARLQECPAVSGVLHKVSAIVLVKLQKWGPRCLERWHAHQYALHMIRWAGQVTQL